MEVPRPYRLKISLRLRHPLREISRCAAEFGLAPLREWRVGDARATPRGKALDGVWSDSYWTAPLCVAEDESVEEALSRVGHWLDEHATFLSEHFDSGGSCSLFVGFFLERFNSGFGLEPALLSEYAARKVMLDFDIYSPSLESEEA